MVGVSFPTMCHATHAAIRSKSAIYWRLILAATLMTTLYTLKLIEFTHERNGHIYNTFKWDQLLLTTVYTYLWSFTVLPTLLYTWQYYDLVERLASDQATCTVLRTLWIIFVFFGILGFTLLQDYTQSLGFWFVEPFTDHFDLRIASHYQLLSNKMIFGIGIFVSLSLLTSAIFLAGTIYLVKKLQAENTYVQTGSLNLSFVIWHISLLLLQAVSVLTYTIGFIQPSDFSEQTHCQIKNVLILTSTVMDLFVIYVICQIIDLTKVQSLIIKTDQELNKVCFKESSSSSIESHSSSDSDSNLVSHTDFQR